MKSRYTRVIWDFNGTLLDDVDLCIELLNRLRAQRGLVLPLSIERYREIFRFPVRAYYELAGFDFSHEPFETVAHQWVAAYNRSEPGTGLRAGALHLLGKLSRDGVRQAVLSATESAMLERQLNRLGIRDHFDRVCGRSDVYAADKAENPQDKTNVKIPIKTAASNLLADMTITPPVWFLNRFFLFYSCKKRKITFFDFFVNKNLKVFWAQKLTW